MKKTLSIGLLSSLLFPGFGVQSAWAADPVIGHVVSSQGGALIRSERPGGKPMRVARAGEPVYVGDTINTASSGAVKLLLTDKTIIDIGASALFNVKKVEGGGPGRKIEVGLPYGTARAAVAKPVGPGGSFNMRSSAATMGVRGTEFVVQSPLEDPRQVNSGPARSALAPERSASSITARTTVTVLQGAVAVERPAPYAMGERGAGRGPATATSGSVLVPAGTQLATVIAPPTSNAGGVAGDGVRGPASQSGDGAAVGGTSGQPVKVDAQTMSSLASTTRIGDSTFKNAITLDLSGDSGGGSSGSGGNSGSQGESAPSSGSSSSANASASSGSGTEQASGDQAAGTGGTEQAGSGQSEGSGAAVAGNDGSPLPRGGAQGASTDASSGGGSLANFTASLILDTVVAPPPAIAAVSAPAAVVQTVAQASFTGGASVENTVTAAQNVAPLTAGGTRRLTVIIER